MSSQFNEDREESMDWRTEPAPTHRCKVCGAMWRFWPKEDTGQQHDTWNLRSLACGDCCDNAPMGEQIEPVTMGQIEEYLKGILADYASHKAAHAEAKQVPLSVLDEHRQAIEHASGGKQAPMKAALHHQEAAEANDLSNESYAGKAVYIKGSRGGMAQYFRRDGVAATGLSTGHDSEQSDPGSDLHGK